MYQHIRQLIRTTIILVCIIGTPMAAPHAANASARGCVDLSSGSDLSGCDFRGIDWRNAALWNLNFTGANLSGAQLDGANLTNANFTGANLTGVSFAGATIDGVTFTGATMTNVSSGGMLGTPTALPTKWVYRSGFLLGPGANLTSATLTGVNLAAVDLTGATLTGVRSGGIIGSPSKLPTGWQVISGFLIGPGANLAGANLARVNLSAANLTNIRSGAITGTPAGLPTKWALIGGYLIGPSADLTNANLAIKCRLPWHIQVSANDVEPRDRGHSRAHHMSRNSAQDASRIVLERLANRGHALSHDATHRRCHVAPGVKHAA
jgi:uncharacterized protein YjbI with pentapeptide repeats